MPISRPDHVLILGGTRDSAHLAGLLTEQGIPVTTSLAGRTRSAKALAGQVRVGGFGGVDGLIAWMKDHGVSHLVDATHPFAAKISHNAYEAAQKGNIPLCRLNRPEWQARDGDAWHHVSDHDSARLALEPYKRVFLAIGRLELAGYSNCRDHWFLMRMIDDPGPIARPDGEIILSRPASAVEDEIHLMDKHRVDCLITKNAGGSASYAKIEAARQLGLPVIMIDRPSLPECFTTESAEGAFDWLTS
ncbi:cobalt-precorrin-6A reductase [Coralliovum pocilloporae]|uniref:cobalt-precorrin-6A reductase n=1 Tax=Coralliovum pocilloporae TaxID=3066369 RepID=UPI003307569F